MPTLPSWRPITWLIVASNVVIPIWVVNGSLRFHDESNSWPVLYSPPT